jgi:hypothetical protein
VVTVSADPGRRKLELKAVNGTIFVGLTTVAAWRLGALVATAAADLPNVLLLPVRGASRTHQYRLAGCSAGALFIVVLIGSLALRHAPGFGSPFPSYQM